MPHLNFSIAAALLRPMWHLADSEAASSAQRWAQLDLESAALARLWDLGAAHVTLKQKEQQRVVAGGGGTMLNEFLNKFQGRHQGRSGGVAGKIVSAL